MPVLTPKQAEEAGKKGLLRYTDEQCKAFADLLIAMDKKRREGEKK